MSHSKKTPKRISPSIKRDAINPKDWNSLPLVYSCEKCVHFSPEEPRCTLGYNCHNHLQKIQDYHYELSGRISFCRFLEID